MLFAIIYFKHYFKNPSAPFHKDMCKNFDNMNAWEFQYLLNIAFRESAKTSFAKIDFIRNIVYKWSSMMFYISYEETIASSNLLDIALELQTNRYLLADFWQLYFDQSNEKKSKKTWATNFLTSNWVRVQAWTVKKTLRWQVFWANRPDYVHLDDIENDITKKSFVKTRTTIDFLEELMTAIDEKAKVVISANMISDTWVISNLLERFRNNKQAHVFEKALIEDWKITWDRFTWEWVEAKKALLNKDWKKRFEQEYLNQPIVDGDRLFETDLIDPMIDIAKTKEFIKRGEHWKIWKAPEIDRYEWPHEYMIGVDISQWFWLDSSTIQVVNRFTWEQVAEYENNRANPSELCDEILWAYEEYNNPIVAPENNSIGQAVISVLKERWMLHILYVEETIDKITGNRVNRYWWNTNSKTKPKVIFDLQMALQEWSLIINSIPLLKELRSFTNGDIDYSTFDSETSRHFDRVMAIAIAWQMRNKKEWFSIGKQSNPFKKAELSSNIMTWHTVINGLGTESSFIKKRNLTR